MVEEGEEEVGKLAETDGRETDERANNKHRTDRLRPRDQRQRPEISRTNHINQQCHIDTPLLHQSIAAIMSEVCPMDGRYHHHDVFSSS